MPEDHGLLSPDEEALLKRVERSQLWRLIKDALCFEREQRFSAEPATDQALWKNWGAIEMIQYLLQNSGMFVIRYRRYMDAQEESKLREKAAAVLASQPAPAERTFDSQRSTPEPPTFDL